MIDVEQHFDVLKFATPPEMKCGDCKNPTTCAATEGLLSHLPTLPKPSISPQTRKFIKEVQERKPEKKKATTVAEAAAQGKSGGAGMMIGAAVISAGLAVGGFFVYQYTQKKDKDAGSGGDVGAITVGDKVGSSAPERPAWIKSDTFFSGDCAEEGAKVMCVGVSSYLSSQEEARDEAKQAAVDALVATVGDKIKDASFESVVKRIYAEARQTARADFDKLRASALAGSYDKNEYDRAHRDLAKKRQAVVGAFEATAPDLKPAEATAEYWEEYKNSSGGGTRYLVFAYYELGADKMGRLMARYTEPQQALGAKAVTLFPAVAWRWPNVDRGAIIIGTDLGKIKDSGLGTETVIQAVNGRPIKDAIEWKTTLEKEVAILEKVGGDLELNVKSGDVGGGTFKIPFARPQAPAGTGGGGNRGGGGGNRGGGGTAPPVPWGNRGGREDPTQ
jgi:hypothetical protein